MAIFNLPFVASTESRFGAKFLRPRWRLATIKTNKQPPLAHIATKLYGFIVFLNGAFLASFFLFLSFLNYTIDRCRGWDLNRGSLVLEATALPTEPQPLPLYSKVKLPQLVSSRNNLFPVSRFKIGAVKRNGKKATDCCSNCHQFLIRRPFFRMAGEENIHFFD